MFKFAPNEASIALILILLAGPAAAVKDSGGTPVRPPVSPPKLEDIQNMVDSAMPSDIKEDNRALLATLMKPTVAPQGPSDAFDVTNAGRVLRLRRATPQKGCFLPRPAYDCTVSDGSRGGGGAYKEIHADSFGNLRFVSRLADPSNGKPESGTPPAPVKYTRDDKAATAGFFDMFVKVFALPPSEAPPVEQWKVRKLAIGIADPDKRAVRTTHVVAGLVDVPRLLKVPGLSTPAIPVIGSRVQGSMDDQGIFRVEIDNWTRFSMPERLAQATAPSRSALVKTIAEDLSRELSVKPHSIKVEIAYAKSSQFSDLAIGGTSEEDGSPSAAAAATPIPAEHRYVPVLLTTVAPTPADSSEEQQVAMFAAEAGLEMVTPLYQIAD